MATITKIRRVANPGGRRRRFSAKRNARLGRNRLGHFVKRKTARRKRATAKRTHRSPVIRRYSAKTLKKELRRRGVKANPSRGRRRHTRRTTRRSTRSNPVLIELGMLNPRSGGTKRRKTSMAKRRYRKATAGARRRRRANGVVRRRRTHRRVNAHRTYRRRRRNPVALAPVRRRRRYARRRHTIHHRRRVNGRRRFSRRNPSVFGQTGSKSLLIMVGGGLVGVAATKFLPTLIPASITSMVPSSPITSVIITGIGAFAAGYLAKRFVSPAFGDAVLFGGLMQTGSALLNAFAPASIARQLALSGVGDIVPGWYPVPQNPVTSRAMAMAPAGVSGFAPGGFGFRRR